MDGAQKIYTTGVYLMDISQAFAFGFICGLVAGAVLWARR